MRREDAVAVEQELEAGPAAEADLAGPEHPPGRQGARQEEAEPPGADAGADIGAAEAPREPPVPPK